MNTISVHLAEKSYQILLGPLAKNASALKALCQNKNILLVTDSNTVKFRDLVLSLIQPVAKQVETCCFPAGESSKTIDTTLKILEHAAGKKLGRDALFIALGGGVCGDMTGFAAAIHMRGVPFIQIPTSLLAMVDSSIGGKTAVDTHYGKNLIGAFHQPLEVFLDPAFLETLSDRDFCNGMAEVIKAGVLGDPELYQILLETDPAVLRHDPELLEQIIFRACDLKRKIVEQDELEQADNIRVQLNYGHSFGHAVELLSDFQLYHGEAVAVGMDMASAYAFTQGLCCKGFVQEQRQLLKRYGFDLDAANAMSPENILDLMYRDKKNRSGKIRLILPESVGHLCVQDIPDPDGIKNFLTQYLNGVRP